MTTIDLFPAMAAVDGETYGKARCRLTNEDGQQTLRIWVEQPTYPHTPHLLVETVVLAVLGNTIGDQRIIRRKQQLIVEILDHSVIEIKPQTGCGCGSRLKSMRFDQLTNQAKATPSPTVAAPYINHKGPVLDDLQLVLSNNWPLQ
jgi:hypothetical protein